MLNFFLAFSRSCGDTYLVTVLRDDYSAFGGRWVDGRECWQILRLLLVQSHRNNPQVHAPNNGLRNGFETLGLFPHMCTSDLSDLQFKKHLIMLLNYILNTDRRCSTLEAF
jgi:hypothetical protein